MTSLVMAYLNVLGRFLSKWYLLF